MNRFKRLFLFHGIIEAYFLAKSAKKKEQFFENKQANSTIKNEEE